MPLEFGKIGRLPPTRGADGTPAAQRLFQGGERFGLDLLDRRVAALATSYWHSSTPTPGTGVAITAAARTTFLATEAALLLRNTSGVATGPLLVLDFIRLICTAAGTAATAVDLICAIEAANRYSSGGTGLTPTNGATDSVAATIADLKYGPVTCTAAGGGVRYFGRTRIKTQAAPCWTVGDEVLLLFGRPTGEGSSAVTGAGPLQITKDLPPAVLAPGGNHSFLLHYWAAAQSAAPSFEIEVGHHEYA
jgi:hypothetical protein